MNSFPINSAVRMSVTFTDIDGVPADPSAVNLYYLPPNGVEIHLIYGTDPIVRDGVGLYHYDVTVQVPGVWFYRYDSSGSLISSTSDSPFRVAGSILVTV